MKKVWCNPAIRTAVRLGAVALASLCLGATAVFAITGKLNIVPILAAAGLCYAALEHQRVARADRRTMGCAALLAAFFAAALVVGTKVNPSVTEFAAFSWTDPWKFLNLWGILLLALVEGLSLLLRYDLPGQQPGYSHKKLACIAGALLFVCWFPYFLNYYPACMSYDSNLITRQALGLDPANDWHPYTYTLFAKLFMGIGRALGNVNRAVAVFTLAQMAFVAAGLGYGIGWLYKRGVALPWVALVTGYFALSPVFALYAITLWKDVPFGVLVLLYSLTTYDILHSQGKQLHTLPGALRYIVLTAMTGLMRHNGFYLVLLTTVVFLCYFRKRILRMLPALLAGLLLVPIVQNIYMALGVIPNRFSQSLSIPIQQIARTVVTEGHIDEEQWASIHRLFDVDILRTYTPRLADNGKDSVNQAYINEHKGEFFQLWASLLPRNFKEYCRAYAMQTFGYWHPRPKHWIVVADADAAAETGIVQNNLLKRWTGVGIGNEYTDRYDFISIGSMVWTVALCGALMWLKGNRKGVIMLFPGVVLWLTTMVATPVFCEFRYVFALPLLLPFALLLALGPPQEDADG